MKKRNILIFLFCLMGLLVKAQSTSEYSPLAEEGKTWSVQLGWTSEESFRNRILGDTVIAGQTWKKVYNAQFPDYERSYFVALRDEGKKVYALAQGSTRPRLLYDFGMKVGDIVWCGNEGNSFGCLIDTGEPLDTLQGFPFRLGLRLERIDTVVSKGKEYRRFTLTLRNSLREWMNWAGTVIWVEGVGSGSGLFSPWLPLPPKESILNSCSDASGNYFGYGQFYAAAAVTSLAPVQNDVHAVGERYDLQGRPASGTPRDVYIQNGRKRLNRK